MSAVHCHDGSKHLSSDTRGSLTGSHRQNAQGSFDKASNADLENEFGTHVDTEVITQILEKGSIQNSQVSPASSSTPNPNSNASYLMTNPSPFQFPERQGSRNEAQGDRIF